MIFENEVSFNEQLIVSDGIGFSNIVSAPTDTSRGHLYLTDNDLVFLPPGSDSTEINLTSLFSGTANRILVFDSNGSLTSSDSLKWNENTGLSLDNDGLNQIALIASINADTNYNNGDVIVEDIVMQVGNTFDSTGSTMQLVGMRVAIESSPNIDGLTLEEKYLAGRLNAGETAVGLLVDVSNVLAEFGTEKATKHAAIFSGGGVGISSGTTFDPAALLHVKEYASDDDYTNAEFDDLFRIDSASLDNIMVVKDT